MRALPLVRIPIGRRSGRSSLRHYSARQAHDEGLIARGPAGADANRYLSVAASLVNLVVTFGGFRARGGDLGTIDQRFAAFSGECLMASVPMCRKIPTLRASSREAGITLFPRHRCE